jgi:gliding motility-associated-like protein
MISFMKKNLLKISIFFLFFTAFSSKAFDVDTLYFCKGRSVNYKSVATSGVAVAWQWTFQGANPGSSNQQNPSGIQYNNAGLFRTTIKTTFDDGSDTTDGVWVLVYDWPITSFSFKDTGYCVGSNVPVTLTTVSYPGVKFYWSTGAKSSSITVNSPGKYTVDVVLRTNNDLCDSVHKEVNITEYPKPSVNLGQDKTMCQNQYITVDAGTGPNYRYLWAPNGEVTRTISVSLPGIYKVTISTDKGCTAEDEIEMIDSCPHFVYVPNAVSPNEDMLNDLFVKVWNFTPKDYTMLILNRWGEILFETNDVTAGWDCKVNGDPVCQDIYVYKITYFDNNKKWYEMRGTFFVVR